MEKLKVKSLIFVMLLALLITCIPSNGFAEGDSLDKTIQRIKTLFEIGEDYSEFDEYEYDYDGKIIKGLSWSNENNNINVTVDEEGNIISYTKNEFTRFRQPRIYKFPKITKEQGEKAAEDFIKKLYPDIFDKIELIDEEELYGIYGRDDLSGYYYNFIMMENDIPFNENSVYINVDNQTGEVTSFNINWEEGLEFQDTNGIISKDEAKEIYKDNVDLELAYRVKETDKDIKTYLGYSIIDTDKTVAAKTKDILSTSYKSAYYVYGPTSDGNMESLSNEEANQLIDSKKIISREEASEKMIDAFKLGEEYEIKEHKLKGNEERDTYIWEVMVMKYAENHASGVSGSINAKTGEVISFSDPGSWDGELEEPKYSKEDLLKKAIEIIKSNSPEKHEEVEYVEDENEDLIYSQSNMSNFLFLRKVNDIRVENEGFMIYIDNTTGNVLTYRYNWNDLEFDSPDNIIQEDKAKEILLEDRELELEYQTVKEDEEKKNVELVYDFKDKYLIVDAKKGEVIDSRQESMERAGIKEYKDIESSYAKDQIEKLQKYIYLFDGDEFKPKQEITQKEFFQLLAQTNTIYLHDDITYIYERFMNDGILKEEEKNMDGKVTREEAIKYIIRAFGQEPLEDIGDIYKIDYDDTDEISDNLKGHVAIAKGLGFISGEGNFRPKDNLTREEAAVIIYNILNR